MDTKGLSSLTSGLIMGGIFILLAYSCTKKHPTEYDLSNFEGITVTDTLCSISSLDPDDWCLANTFVGSQLYLYPKGPLYFICDSIGQTIINTINIFNFSDTDVEITEITVDYPFGADPSSAVVRTNSWFQIMLSFTLPDSGTYAGDIRIHNSSSDSPINVSVVGKLDDGSTPTLPRAYALGPACPNPTSTVASIKYALPKESHVVMKIINRDGKLITTLVDSNLPPGNYSVSWDIIDPQGEEIHPPGLYRCTLQADDFSCHGDIQVE